MTCDEVNLLGERIGQMKSCTVSSGTIAEKFDLITDLTVDSNFSSGFIGSGSDDHRRLLFRLFLARYFSVNEIR